MRHHEALSDIQHNSQTLAAGYPSSEEAGESIDLREYLRVLYRRRGVIVGIFSLVMVGVVLYLWQVVPLYTAHAQLTLDLRKTKVTNIEDVMSGLTAESSVIGTEMDILRSSSLVGRMVDKLRLAQDPAFNPSLNPEQQSGLFDSLATWFSSLWLMAPDAVVDTDTVAQHLRQSIIERLQLSLKVEQKKITNTITVSFTNPDASRAAQLANTLAELYLTDQLEAKFDATKQANEWLANRLETLRKEVQEAEQAVKKIREQGKIVQGKGGTILEQQLGDINAQLVAAQVKVSQAEARLRGGREMAGRSGGVESLGEVLNSTAVQNLRGSETELRRKKAELGQRYGDKHPQVIQVEAELKDVRSKLHEETNRILQNLENELRVARAAESTLQRSLAELQAQAGRTMDTELQARELERRAESSRTLYQAFLSRFQETKEQEHLQRPDARVISKADIPGEPSSPQKNKVLLLGAFAGFILGIGGAFLLESLDRGFRTSAQVEQVTGLPVLGMVPLLNISQGSVVDYVTQKPFSALAEALRAIRNAIHLANVDKPAKTVMVTSSLPSEGKSSFSASIGRLAAAAGTKTLLIDADLRRPSLAKLFSGLEREIKLEDLLQNDTAPKEAIAVDPETNLHILFAHGKTPLTAELLGSLRMQQLLDQLSQEFELILIDTPPIMGISDGWKLARHIDSLVYLVEWAETPRETVQTALRQLEVIGISPTGLVLSKVNMRQQQQYGYGGYGYYYSKYQNYYHN
jgi:capsular exopolysaccharide synthesis family protein